MSGELKAGTRVRVCEGIADPEFPDLTIAGWTGAILEVKGKKGAKKYFVEWDDETVGQMSSTYLEQCEEKQLWHKMACLTREDLEPLDS